MAITIQQVPQKFTTAGNPVVYTFESDQTSQANFSYIVELYVAGNLYSTHQVFPQFNILSKFNASEAMKSFLSSPLITNGSLITNYFTAIVDIYIEVTEKYGTPPVPQASATSGIRKIFNGALRHPEWIGWNYLEYNVSRLNLIAPVDYLTSWPRSKKFFCALTERAFLGFITDRKNTINVEFALYDSTNTLITLFTFAPPSGFFQDMSIIDASPSTIIANTTITAIDFSTTAYYEVRAFDIGIGINPGSTEAYKIYIDNYCHQYTTRRLHWLNKFGAWDSFSFTLVSTESTSIEGSMYEKEKGVWNGINYTYPLFQGEISTFSKRAEDTMILNSDWINQDVQQWLVRELLESPNVFLESQGSFEPVNVTNKNYTFKQRKKDGLIQEVIEIKKTYSYNSQLN